MRPRRLFGLIAVESCLEGEGTTGKTSNVPRTVELHGRRDIVDVIPSTPSLVVWRSRILAQM